MTRVSTYGSVSPGIRQGSKHERGGERERADKEARSGIRNPTWPRGWPRSFRYRSGETNRDEGTTCPWGGQGRSGGGCGPKYTRTADSHQRNRWSALARSTDHHLRRWPSYFRRARQCHVAKQDRIPTSVYPWTTQIFLQPISILEIFPTVILCVLYFLNAFISLFSLSFFGRYQFQFFSLIRNPSIDFYLTINPSNQFQFVSRNFPFIDFLSQNHLTYSSLMDNKIFTRLHKENSFCQSSPNLFIFVFQSLSILSSVRGSAHSLFKSILLIQFFAISREKKGNGMCTSAQKERKKKADTADKFFTGEIHR